MKKIREENEQKEKIWRDYYNLPWYKKLFNKKPDNYSYNYPELKLLYYKRISGNGNLINYYEENIKQLNKVKCLFEEDELYNLSLDEVRKYGLDDYCCGC